MDTNTRARELRFSLLDEGLAPLNVTEAFYLATKGGGEFFENVGSFESGYEFDAVVLSEETLPQTQPMTYVKKLLNMRNSCTS